MKIDNTFISGDIAWKNNIPNSNQNTIKPTTDNNDLRNKISDRTRASTFSKAETESPKNAAKDIITAFGSKQSILQMTSKAFSLLQMLNQLRGSDGLENSYFHAKRPFSGNTNVLQIKSFNLAAMRGADISNLSVDVLQVAQAQRNEGAAMDPNALATEEGFTEGSHHITMNVNGRDVDIRFDVSATDRVEDVQRKIADAINDSGVGARASIISNEDTGRTSLVVESKETGVDAEGQPNFTFKSIKGNAVEISGIGNITQDAQNALFRVNRGLHSVGEIRSSRSNTVDVGFGITVQLFGTGSSRLSLGRDDRVQFNTIRDMVGLYNDLMAFGQDNEQGDLLMRELSAIAEESSSILSRIGITFNLDGFMRIDEDQLRTAAASGELEKFALQDGTEFINNLAKLLEDMGKNPMDFLGVENPLLNILH